MLDFVNFITFFHPGDLNSTECFGTLVILAFPIIAVFIFVYVLTNRKNK